MSYGQPPPGGHYGPPGGAPHGGYQGGQQGGFGAPPGGGNFGPPPGYPPSSYGAPGYAPHMQGGGGETDSLSVVSLVLGLVSLPMHFCCYLGWPLGIGAIICGIIAMSRAGTPPHYYSGKGFAIGGIVAAGVGFVMFIGVLAIYGAAIMLSKP